MQSNQVSARLAIGLLRRRPARLVDGSSAAVLVSTSSMIFSSARASSVESEVSFPFTISFSVVAVAVVGAASVVLLSLPSSPFIFLPSSGNSCEDSCNNRKKAFSYQSRSLVSFLKVFVFSLVLSFSLHSLSRPSFLAVCHEALTASWLSEVQLL